MRRRARQRHVRRDGRLRRSITCRTRVRWPQNAPKNVVVERPMTSSSSLPFQSLTDDQLLAEVQQLVTRDRQTTAEILRVLIAVEARRLYLREGYSSLFTYCTQVLHMDDGAAYNRIETARAAKRVPALLEAIGDGSLTLSSARLLAPHLTLENYAELLQAARHRSKREVEALIARLAPKPAVATVLRKLPAQAHADVTDTSVMSAPGPTREATAIATSAIPVAQGESPAQQPHSHIDSRRPHARNAVAPLSADAYKLQVTVSAATEDKLRRARDLLRHSVPDGDFAQVLDRALTLLVADLERRRCAAATVSRTDAQTVGHTRHIPAAVKREVWRRDEGRCAFRAGSRRCTETAFLEFHHVVPYVDGGPASVANIELRCRAHNQYEATLLFGREDSDRDSARFAGS